MKCQFIVNKTTGEACGKEFDTRLKFGSHLKKHKVTLEEYLAMFPSEAANIPAEEPDALSMLPPQILEAARAEVSKIVTEQLTGIVPQIMSQVNETVKQAMSGMGSAVDERFKMVEQKLVDTVVASVNKSAEQIATQAQKEIEARLGLGAGGQGAGAMNPVAQAFLTRLVGGGGGGGGSDFLDQASKVGQAIQSMTAPWATLQTQMFANALRLIDLAQKMPTMPADAKEAALAALAEGKQPVTSATK